MAHLKKPPYAELRERAQDIPEHLGDRPAAGHEAEVEQSYELPGRRRFEEWIPLHEAVQALAIIKDKMIDFVHGQVWMKDAIYLYAEEELERRVCHFFDALTVHLVRVMRPHGAGSSTLPREL